MTRVYANLRRRIMDGEFAPGTRLDPSRLRGDLAASITPIRDALHRLTGEGLVESWQNEGFRIGFLSEPELRDQYEWSRLLIRLAIETASLRGETIGFEPVVTGDYPTAVTALLQQIADFSPNHELRRATARLSDRMRQYRTIELALLPMAIADVPLIERALLDRDWRQAGTLLEQFHDRRIAIVPQLLAVLWDRSIVQRK